MLSYEKKKKAIAQKVLYLSLKIWGQETDFKTYGNNNNNSVYLIT